MQCAVCLYILSAKRGDADVGSRITRLTELSLIKENGQERMYALLTCANN